MASMVCASSALSGHSSLVKRLRITNSKSSWVNPNNSPIKGFYSSSSCVQHFSYKNKYISVESSFFQGGGFSAFSLIPKFSRVATPKSSSFKTITAQLEDGLVQKSIYQFKPKRHGKHVSLRDEYGGKVLLIVNIPEQGSPYTDSEYNFLHGLRANYRNIKPGFEILGFLYDAKETGGEQEIEEQREKIKTAKFPLFDKVELNRKYWVNWGNDRGLWYFLRTTAPGGGDVKNEFEKILVDWQGIPLHRYDPFPLYDSNVPQQSGGRPSSRVSSLRSPNVIEDDIKDIMRIK